MDEFPQDFTAKNVIKDISKNDVWLKKLRCSIYNDIKEKSFYSGNVPYEGNNIQLSEKLKVLTLELTSRQFYVDIKVLKENGKLSVNICVHISKEYNSYLSSSSSDDEDEDES